jgi:hypothetical protein
MELQRGNEELERLNHELNDPEVLKSYKQELDGYTPAIVPRLLGKTLVWLGNVIYGKEPSYLKFRAVEVIARVPYHSWASAAYTLLTMFYANEQKAMLLSNVAKYARLAQDNETMHVVVISKLAQAEGRAGVIRYTLIPMVFAFFYFWASYILFLVKPRYSYELNFMFENHAFLQYDRFLELHGEALKKKYVQSEFLSWYGRHPKNQYEFFLSVRNDEIIHRNTSIHEIH